MFQIHVVKRSRSRKKEGGGEKENVLYNLCKQQKNDAIILDHCVSQENIQQTKQ